MGEAVMPTYLDEQGNELKEYLTEAGTPAPKKGKGFKAVIGGGEGIAGEEVEFESYGASPYPAIFTGTGAVLGGLAGSLVGAPNIGAGVGAGLMEGINEGIRSAIDEEEFSLAQSAGRVGMTAGLTVAGGKVGELAFKGIGKLVAPMAGKLIPQAQRILQRFGAKYVRPAQVAQSQPMDWLDQVAGSSIGGGGIIKEQETALAGQIQNAVDDFVGLFGQIADPEAQARTVLLSLNQSDKIWRATGNALYGKIDAYAKTAAVDISPLKLWAQRELNRYGPTARSTMGAGITILENILKEPRKMSFAYANQLRSVLGKASTPGVPAGRDPIRGIASKAVEHISNAMTRAQSEMSGSNVAVANAIKAANKHWKDGAEIFNNQLIRKLIVKGKPDPELITDYFFKPFAIDNVKLIRSALGGANSPAWKQTQQLFVRSVFRKSIAPATGEISGNTAKVFLANMGNNTVDEILSPIGAKALRELVDDIAIVQGKTGATGSLFIQMKQAGAITQMAGLMVGAAGSPGTAAAFIFGPIAMAKAFTHPLGQKWLTTGLRHPLGSIEATRAAGQLMHLLANDPDRDNPEFGQFLIDPNTLKTPITPTGVKPISQRPTGNAMVAAANKKKLEIGITGRPKQSALASMFTEED
jgi:hypothetical protein